MSAAPIKNRSREFLDTANFGKENAISHLRFRFQRSHRKFRAPAFAMLRCGSSSQRAAGQLLMFATIYLPNFYLQPIRHHPMRLQPVALIDASQRKCDY